MSNIGLNIVETDGKATPSIQPAQTSVAAFLILSERGVPGVARQVVNFSQFREYFGSHIKNANGAFAVQGFFDNGGTMAYVARMVITKSDKSGVIAAIAASAKPTDNLKVRAGYMGKKDPGIWGNDLEINITLNSETKDGPEDKRTYDLEIRLKEVTVENWTELTDIEEAKTVLNNPSSGSKYIMIDSASRGELQAIETPAALAGGCDDNQLWPENVFDAIDETAQLFKTEDVQLVCCPESSQTEVIGYLLNYCRDRGDCMFVGHTLNGASKDDAKTFGKEHRGTKEYGALYFPWIRVYDPVSKGSEHRFIPPTGHVMGVYARTERERGIWKAPAGNAARIYGALDVQRHITDREHTDLVKNASVNAVRFIPGQGIIIDSSRTLSTNSLWLYVNVRLLFNFVKSSLKNGLRWVSQEPNNEELWDKIKFNTVRPFLMGLWRRGAFGPGKPEDVFSVKVDKENNQPKDIQNGILTVEVYFYPSRPAETIIITIGQQEGGASAGEN